MSPFKSKKQMRWMFSNDPERAKQWADETPDIKDLPNKVSNKPKKAKTSKLESAIMKADKKYHGGK